LIDNYKRNMVPLMKLEKRTANLVFARQGVCPKEIMELMLDLDQTLMIG
jgi:hypothetical protein